MASLCGNKMILFKALATLVTGMFLDLKAGNMLARYSNREGGLRGSKFQTKLWLSLSFKVVYADDLRDSCLALSVLHRA